jgi:hypothetical protein
MARATTGSESAVGHTRRLKYRGRFLRSVAPASIALSVGTQRAAKAYVQAEALFA